MSESPTDQRAQFLTAAINDAIQQEVHRVVSEEAEEAAKRTEKRVRSLIPNIVSEVSSYYDMSEDRGCLRITVRFPEKGEQP